MARRLIEFPLSCPKCHSKTLEMLDTACVNCLLCGWTGFIREPSYDRTLEAPVKDETPFEYRSRGGKMRASALTTMNKNVARRRRISEAMRGTKRHCSRCKQTGHYAATCPCKSKKN